MAAPSRLQPAVDQLAVRRELDAHRERIFFGCFYGRLGRVLSESERRGDDGGGRTGTLARRHGHLTTATTRTRHTPCTHHTRLTAGRGRTNELRRAPLQCQTYLPDVETTEPALRANFGIDQQPAARYRTLHSRTD